MSRPIDLAGQRFGRLVVIGPAPAANGLRWTCRCDCGNKVIVRGNHLRRTPGTVSCGCRQRDSATENRPPAKEVVTYSGAHMRLHALRGSASKYPCVDCGGPAKDWSYDGADPNEIKDRRGPYSLDPDHYHPRCGPCHARFDQAMKRAS